MHELISNITLVRHNNDLTITISKIEDGKIIDDEIEAKIQSNNTFRFSFVHPGNNIKEQYTGHIEKRKAWLYPQYGSTFIIKDAILIMEIT